MTDWTIDKVAAQIEKWDEPTMAGEWQGEVPLHKAGLLWLVAENRRLAMENTSCSKASLDFTDGRSGPSRAVWKMRHALTAAEAVVETARMMPAIDSREDVSTWRAVLARKIAGFDKMKGAGDGK